MLELSPQQQADLELVYYCEFERRIKAGESAPFASAMAARLQLIERNKLLRI